MEKADIVSCLKKHPNINLSTLCEELGAVGSLDQVGQIGTLVGELIRDGVIIRDDTKRYPHWPLSVVERSDQETIP